MQPWECNGVISCGKVVVRPGDAIIGDQDGVVVVPAAVAQQVYDNAHGREEIEVIIKEELMKSAPLIAPRLRVLDRCSFASCFPRPPSPQAACPLLPLFRLRRHPPSLSPRFSDPGPPGKYYPFKPPIKPESPLGKLLTSKVRCLSIALAGAETLSLCPANLKLRVWCVAGRQIPLDVYRPPQHVHCAGDHEGGLRLPLGVTPAKCPHSIPRVVHVYLVGA